MSLEEKINFVEGQEGQVSNIPPRDPFHALTGQAPPQKEISTSVNNPNVGLDTNVPEKNSAIPSNVDPTLHVPKTPYNNHVPGIEDYVQAMNIDELFPDKYIPGLDPQFKQYVDAAAPFINGFNSDLTNTVNYDQHGPASANYDPFTELTGQPDYNTTHGRNQGTLKAFQQASINSPEANNPGFRSPYGFSIKGQNMDRYIYHPKYDKLGFNVFSDNEAFYNAGSSWVDDMQRTVGQWYQIFGPAFGGTYRSFADLFKGDFGGDEKASRQMEDSMRIASSTRGGVGGFFNDFALNSSYTIAMLSSIVAEELAMFGMAAAGTAVGVGGTATLNPPAAAAGGSMFAAGVAGMLKALARIPKAFQIPQRLKAVKNLIGNLSDARHARAWYDAAKLGKKGLHNLAQFLAPETLYALKNLKHAKSAGQNILNLAHTSKSFGAFYRDVRMYNLALSESKLESGMVENKVFETLYQEFVDREGRAPTKEEMELIKHNSSRAGIRTLQANFPIIFLSNKIVLDGWIKGPKSITRLMDEHRAGIGSKVFDSGKRLGKKSKGGKKYQKGDRYKEMTEKGSWWDVANKWKRAKERGLRGNIRYAGAGALRVTPPMFVEGMQEIYQEGVAHAAEHYFGGITGEEIRTGIDLLQLNLGKENWDKDFFDSLKKGANSQFFTPEGGKVFMSGFLMGGLMGPSSTFFFQTIPNLYRAKQDPLTYQKYLDQKKNLLTKYVEKLNRTYEDPFEYLDPIKMNSSLQKQLNRRKKRASLEGDMLDMKDAEQDSLFSEINMLYDTGHFGHMQEAIDDFLKMDNDTLAEAFPENEFVQKKDFEGMREKLKSIKEKMSEIKENKDRFTGMFPGKARPQDYKTGSQEWVQQVVLQAAENYARNLLIYNKSEMLDSAKRMEEITEWILKHGPLANVASLDISVLQSKNKMQEELYRLNEFIDLKALTPQEKTAKANAKKKRKALQELFDVLFDPANQTAKVNAMKDLVLPGGKKVYKLDENNEKIPVIIDGVVQKDEGGNIIYEMIQISKNPVENQVGGYNKQPSYIKKLRRPFINYLKTLAEISGDNTSFEVDKVDEMIKKIVDYGYLNNRIGDFQAAIDILIDPGSFYDTAGRIAYTIERQWKKYKNSHYKRIKKYVETHGERVQLLKTLAKYTGPGGPIYPDPDEVENFLSKDEITSQDIPVTFFQKDGMIEFDSFSGVHMAGAADPDTIAEIKRVREVQIKLIQGEHIHDESNEDIEDDVEHVMNIDEDLVETQEEKEEAKENKKTLKEFYEEDSDTGKYTRDIMKREHKKYKARSVFQPHSFDFDTWWKHPKLGQKILQARLMAHEIYLKTPQEEKDKYANFDDWLIKNIRKNTQLDSEIFTPLNVNGYTILNKVVVDQNLMPGILDESKDQVLAKDLGKGLFLIKYETDTQHPTTGKMEYAYKIIDAEGNNAFDKYAGLELNDSSKPLQSGWSSQVKAQEAYKNLLLSIPDTKTYPFEGMKFTQGETIISQNGVRYIVATNQTQASIQGFVYLKPMGPEARDVTTWKKILNKKDFEDRGFKKFNEDYSKLDLDKGKRYKLNINYPIQFWSNPKEGTATKEEFQNFLRNLSPDSQKSLQITIRKNPEFKTLLDDEVSDLDIAKRGEATNEYVRKGAPRFIVSIMNGTEEVARLQGYQDMILVDPATGLKILPKNMTKKQMEEIFNLTYVGSRYRIKTKDQALEEIKKNYRDGQIIDQVFNEVLADKDAVSINLFDLESLNEQFNDSKLVEKLEMLSFSLSQGNFAHKELDPEGRETNIPAKIPFSDVRYSQFKFIKNEDGELIPVGIDNKTDEKGFYYIIDQIWVWEEETGSRIRQQQPPIHNIDTSTKEGVAQLAAIEKYVRTAEQQLRGFDYSYELGRYVMVSILPNGQLTFVEMQAKVMEEKAIDKFLSDLKDRQLKTKKENINKDGSAKKEFFNLTYNENLDNIYIAGYPLENYHIRLSKYGNLIFTYTRNIDAKNQVTDFVALKPEDIKDVTNIKEFFSKVLDKWNEKQNKLVADGKTDIALEFTIKDPSLQETAFRHAITKEATMEEIMETEASTRPEVRNNIGLTLTVTDAAYFQVHKDTEVDGKDTIENQKREQEEVDPKEEVGIRNIDGNFIKEYDPELGGKGWNQVSPVVLQYLTNKLGDVKGVAGLSHQEKVVVQETDLIKRIEDGEFKKEIKEISFSEKRDQIKIKDLEIKKYKKLELQKIKEELDKLVSEGKMSKVERNIKYVEGKMDFLENDPGLIALEGELEDIKGHRAYKITDNFDGRDVEDINIFINWAKNNLPGFIDVQDINTLQKKLNNRGITIGMFMIELKKVSGNLKFLGKIYTSPTSGYRYHEAFHSVFRMLLTDQEIAVYLDIAKKEVRKKLRKDGKKLKDELAKMRTQSPTYANLSEQQLEERYYEEYLADRFEDFKQNPKTRKVPKGLKGFFVKLIEWIKSVFERFSNSETSLNRLYRDIDSGKYKDASIQSNRFTDAASIGVTEPVFKIRVGTTTVYKNIDVKGKLEAGEVEQNIYLSASDTNKLKNGIGGLYLRRLSKIKGEYIPAALLNEAIEDYIQMYNPARPFYVNEDNGIPYDEIEEELFEKFEALNKTEVKREIAEEINNWLNLFDLKIDLENELLDYQLVLEDQDAGDGVPSVGDWDMQTNQMGGFRNLPQALRAFIAMTTLEEVDQFGNKYIPRVEYDGKGLIIKESRLEEHVQAVDYTSAYNGLLKAVSGATTPMEILQGLVLFSQTSTHSKAVIDRFFREMGIKNYNSLLDQSPAFPVNEIESANPAQFNQIIKSLHQFTVDYMFIEKNTKKGKTEGHVDVYAANHKDDSHNQINKWNSAYDATYWKRRNLKSFRNTAANSVNLLYNHLNTTSKSIDDGVLLAQSKTLSQDIFEKTGIKLSQGFIRFSILKKIKLNAGNELLSPIQEKILVSNKDVEFITAEDARYFSGLLSSGRDLFANFDTKIGDNKSQDKELKENKTSSGIQSRLKKFARGNAIFDETVGTTVFRDPEGNLIYSHQLPTFHLESIKELNGGYNTIKKLKSGYNENNNLLEEDSSFGILSANGEIRPVRISGQKQVVVSIDKDSGDVTVIESDGVPGVTYGDSTPSDMLASVINTVLWNFNASNGKVKTVTNKFGKEVAVIPSLIRVIEAANTGDFVELGSVHSVEYTDIKKKEFKLTQDYIDRHINNIRSEYNRIYFETQELNNPNRDRIKGYNDVNSLDEVRLLDDDHKAARAFKLTNTGDLVTIAIVDEAQEGKKTRFTLDDTIKIELEEMARQGIPFEQAMKEFPVNVEQIVENRLNFEFDQFLEKLLELGAYDKISAAFSTTLKTNKGVINENVKRSMAAYNFKKDDERYNLAQIFHSDFINTVDINKLLLGDQAISLKDSIDKIKRAKAQNAAGPNAQSLVGWKEKGIEATSEIKIVTHTDPTHTSQFNLDVSKEEKDPKKAGTQDTMDAQIYMTIKGLKHTQFGMGRLTLTQLEIIERIEKGEKVSWYDWFGDPDKGSLGLKKGKGALNSQKYVYADGVTYLKMSIVPLVREEVSYWKDERWVARPTKKLLHNLLNKMEAEEAKGGIMMSVPETASKMMKKNVMSHEDVFNTDKPLDKDGPLQTIQARYLRLQQVNPFGKTEIPDIRQMKQLILSEQVNSTPVTIRGVKTTVGQLRKDYEKAVGDRVELGFATKRNLIVKLKDKENTDAIYGFLLTKTALQNKENIDIDLYSILQYSINALKASQSKQQMLDFFEVDETGTQKFNLNNPITRQSFEEKFFSFWNDTFAEKQPGTSYTLKSSYGHKVLKQVEKLDPITKQPIKWRVVRDKDYEAMDLRGEAPVIVKEDYDNLENRTFVELEVNDYYIDDLRHDVIIWNEDGTDSGQKGSEFIAPPQFSSAIRFLKEGGVIPEVIAKQFGVRVPSQDKHSAINLILVDFSPAYLGNSAIFTRELIEISGADFDIDQLYTQFKEFFVEKTVVKTSEEIEGEWAQWVSTPQWSPKSQTNIVRTEIKGFNVERSKKEFAAAKRNGDLTYDPNINAVGELVVQESATNKIQYGKNNQYRYNKNFGFSDIVEAKVVEYGKQDLKIEQEHNEYLRWVIGQANKPGSLIYLALNQWNNQNSIFEKIKPKDIPVHASSQMKFIKNFVEMEGMVYGALELIGLPTDLKSYKSWKQIHNKGKLKGNSFPYTAAMNNQILDYKVGLLGNKSISEALPGRKHAIKNEPANLSPLTNSISKEGVLEIIQELVPELKQMIDQGQINVDNLLGKVMAFESNKEGANSIGAAVIPNVVVNVLQMFDIDLRVGEKIDHRLNFNNIDFGTFGNPYIKDDNGTPDIQKRKQYIISAIITAMTDNAKEQLASKLGLNKDALAIAVNMTALGVPIKTSILLIKNPSVQEAYKNAKNKKKITDPGVGFWTEATISQLEIELGKRKKKDKKSVLEEDVETTVTDNSLLKSLRNFTESGFKSVLDENYLKSLSDKEIKDEISILYQFLKARNIKTYTGKMQSLITLLAGVGRDVSSVNNKLEDFSSLGLFEPTESSLSEFIPFDIRSIVNDKNTMLGRYFNTYMQFTELLPSIFITRTLPFMKILEGMHKNLSSDFTRMTKAKETKVVNDILSILTLKAYEYQLSLDSTIRPSLSNSMLYKSVEGSSITGVIEKIKEVLGDKENTFIDHFTYLNERHPGLDLLESNTWAQLSDSQLQDIQLSFLELFKDENTRDLAYDIIHYAIVKDGLQSRMGSFLRALPADMLDGPINAISRVDDFFKGKVKSRFEDVFGMSEENLMRTFDNYFEHISNGTILRKIKSYFKGGKEMLKTAKIKTPIVKTKDGSLGISVISGIKKFPSVDDTIKTVYIPFKELLGANDYILETNASYIKKMGWKVTQKTIEIEGGVSLLYEDISFPKVIVRTEKIFPARGKSYNVERVYKLDKIYKLGDKENSTQLPTIIESHEGVGAIYKIMNEGLKGTKEQYGGGTIVAGNVPFSSTLNPKQSKTGRGNMSQSELDSYTPPGGKAFNPTHPNAKQIKVTNKGIKVTTKDDKEHTMDNIPKNLKASGPPQEAIEAGKKRAAAEKSAVEKAPVEETKKEFVSKDRYIEVKVKNKDYIVTNDGKVINNIEGSKNRGTIVKKDSELYKEAIKLAEEKKAKEETEIPSIEEAVEIVQKMEEEETPVEETEDSTEETPVEEIPIEEIHWDNVSIQEKILADFWNSLNVEQKNKVLDGAFKGIKIKSATELIKVMRDLKIEPTDKVIENLKCYM